MSGSNVDRDREEGVAVQESRPELKPPPRYKVLLLNDDFTPMEFVVQVLETFFHLNREKATQIMLHVHTRGVGVCGLFARDVAETKAKEATELGKANGFPLYFTTEKEE